MLCKSASWLYMSRLAAMKEFAFMKALYDEGFPTPIPIEQNRHVVLMSRVPGFPMSQVRAGQMEKPMLQLGRSLDILVRLAKHGLIHCDLNEFNLMVSRSGEVTVIDFPQMISTSHENASMYFDRDVKSIIKFFKMKMKITIPDNEVPTFAQVLEDQVKLEELLDQEEGAELEVLNEVETGGANIESETGGLEAQVMTEDGKMKKDVKRRVRLDEVVKASGYISAKQDEQLVSYIEEQRLVEAEVIAAGGTLERDDDAEGDDDVLLEEEEEEEEEERGQLGAAEEDEENTPQVEEDCNHSEDEQENDSELFEKRSRYGLCDLNPQETTTIIKNKYEDKYEYNDEGESSGDDEDGSIRAGWSKESSVASDYSTSTTSTHSRGYHGTHYRPNHHRFRNAKPEGKRNSSKLTYRGSKIHKPKA